MTKKKVPPAAKTVTDEPQSKQPNIFDELVNLFEANCKSPSHATESELRTRLVLLKQNVDGMHLIGYQAGIRAAANWSSQFSENPKEEDILKNFGLGSVTRVEDQTVSMSLSGHLIPVTSRAQTKKRK